jgi:hypothetical protein
MASPDADDPYGRIAGAAARLAPAWRLGGEEKAAAVAELAEAAGGRADLLAKCAGLALGYGEWQPEAAHYRRMAELCIAAGADQALIGRWIKAGQQRAATGMATPYTALPQAGNVIRSSRSDNSVTRRWSRATAVAARSCACRAAYRASLARARCSRAASRAACSASVKASLAASNAASTRFMAAWASVSASSAVVSLRRSSASCRLPRGAPALRPPRNNSPRWRLPSQRGPLSAEASATPAALTARARPEARPEARGKPSDPALSGGQGRRRATRARDDGTTMAGLRWLYTASPCGE